MKYTKIPIYTNNILGFHTFPLHGAKCIKVEYKVKDSMVQLTFQAVPEQ